MGELLNCHLICVFWFYHSSGEPKFPVNKFFIVCWRNNFIRFCSQAVTCITKFALPLMMYDPMLSARNLLRLVSFLPSVFLPLKKNFWDSSVFSYLNLKSKTNFHSFDLIVPEFKYAGCMSRSYSLLISSPSALILWVLFLTSFYNLSMDYTNNGLWLVFVLFFWLPYRLIKYKLPGVVSHVSNNFVFYARCYEGRCIMVWC